MLRHFGFPSTILISLLLAGCGGDVAGDRALVSSVDPVSVFNDADTPVQVRGERLGKTIRALLWAGTPERLQRQLRLDELKVASEGALSFTVPAGALPGEYMVVLQTEESTSFSKLKLKVAERPGDPAPRVIRVQGALYSDVPSRFYLVGPGMNGVTEVQLAGGSPVNLKHLRAYSAARLGASLEEGAVGQGKYRVRLKSSHGWTDGPEVTVSESGHAQDSRLCFITYFGVLGAVFFLGLFLAYRQGDVGLDTPVRRRNLGVLLSGLVFTFALLGSVQLGLSWWR